MSYETLVYNRAAVGSNYSGGVFTPSTDVTSTNWVIRNDTQDDMNVGDTVNVYDDDNGNLIYSNATFKGYFQFGSAQRPFVQLNNGDYALFGRPGFGTYNITSADFTQGSIVCFAAGTLIRTTRGDIAVEKLTLDDVAITRDGRRKPIRWIGHSHVRCDNHPEPRKVWPVRVAAGTFGNGLPYADLWLSRNHALCLDNSLVPVRGLLDGDRITQVQLAEVTYWHVEVDGHDVLLANGLPAESYLDTGNRRGFDNAEVPLLHFDEEPAPSYDGAGYCLPVIESGPLLSEIRARYGLGRAAATAQTVSAVHLVADGVALMPVLAGENEVRFVVPADTVELRLSSPSFAASGADVRQLGVLVSSLAVSDGSGWRVVSLDDPGLFAGFHEIEHTAAGMWRWTDGEAHLSPSLWSELSGAVLMRLVGMFSLPAAVEAADTADRLAA